MTAAVAGGLLLSGSAQNKTVAKKETEVKKEVAAKKVVVKEKTAAEKKRTVQIALLLDTSGSMSGLIRQAKLYLWDIVNELGKGKVEDKNVLLEIALYEYGNDSLNSKEGYIRQVVGFSSDLDLVSEKLFALKTNGGSEFCGKVVDSSTKELAWFKKTANVKMMFVAGNEPFTQGPVNYRVSCAEAKKQGIIVNTIHCGDFNTGIQTKWQDGALVGGGSYFHINHNHKEVAIDTPMDKKILAFNQKLNATYVAYGAKGKILHERQMEQDKNADKLSSKAIQGRIAWKSSANYSNARWDLVDACKDKKFDITKVKKEHLPKELQGKTNEELKAYVKEKQEERTKIQGEISKLNKERTAWIIKKRAEMKKEGKTKENTLQDAMIKALKNQCVKQGIDFKKEEK